MESRANHTATLLPDGRVLVIGGWNDSGFLASVEVWDPTTETFGPAGSLDEARSLHITTPLPDGPVLVIGGEGDDGPLASAEIWSQTVWDLAPVPRLATQSQQPLTNRNRQDQLVMSRRRLGEI